MDLVWGGGSLLYVLLIYSIHCLPIQFGLRLFGSVVSDRYCKQGTVSQYSFSARSNRGGWAHACYPFVSLVRRMGWVVAIVASFVGKLIKI